MHSEISDFQALSHLAVDFFSAQSNLPLIKNSLTFEPGKIIQTASSIRFLQQNRLFFVGN